MTPAWANCPACQQPLYPRTARRTDDGWACADGRACYRRKRTADRLEDVTWLAETGETPDGAAGRLGLTVNGLEKWCDRHARHLWAQLMGNRRDVAA